MIRFTCMIAANSRTWEHDKSADARKREFARDHAGQAVFVASDELRAFVSGVEDFQRLRWEAGVDARVGAAHRAQGALADDR